MRGGMRYATPPPRLLIIHSLGERDVRAAHLFFRDCLLI